MQCLLKAFEGLKPGGSLVVRMSAPTRGAYKDLQETVCAVKPGQSTGESLLRAIKELRLPFIKTETQATITATAGEFDMFLNTIRMFGWSWNKTVLAGYNNMERSRVERGMENFAKKCFDPTTGNYYQLY